MRNFKYVFVVFMMLASASFAQTPERVEAQDRGDTIVYTFTKTVAVSAEEVCTTVTVQEKDKKTNRIISTETSENCQTLGL